MISIAVIRREDADITFFLSFTMIQSVEAPLSVLDQADGPPIIPSIDLSGSRFAALQTLYPEDFDRLANPITDDETLIHEG